MRDAVVQIVQTDIERRGSSSKTVTTPITLVVASLNLRRLGAAKHATRDRLLDELGIASATVTQRPFKGFCFGHITRRGKLCRPWQRTDGIVVVCHCVHCGVPHGAAFHGRGACNAHQKNMPFHGRQNLVHGVEDANDGAPSEPVTNIPWMIDAILMARHSPRDMGTVALGVVVCATADFSTHEDKQLYRLMALSATSPLFTLMPVST